MPRRYLKDRYRASERINAASPEARDCWVRLFVTVDDYGCYFADPRIVASACYPLDPDASTCEQLLAELERHRLIGVYSGPDGKLYLYLAQWDDSPRSAPKYPALPEGLKAALDAHDGFTTEFFARTDAREQLHASAINCEPRARARVSPSPSPSPSPPPSPTDSGTKAKSDRTEVTRRIFEHWQTVMGHPTAKLTRQRALRIRDRLREGYSEAALIAAIDGCKASSFHMGQNDRAAVYDDLELILRNGGKVEQFARLTGAAPLQRLSVSGRQTAENLKGWLSNGACDEPKEIRDGTQG